MKFKHPILLVITVALLTLQCRKDRSKPSTTLPPITQEGKNTFGCKVDGEVWVPYYKCNIGNNPCGELFMQVFRTNPDTPFPLSFNINAGIKDRDNTLTSFRITTHFDQGIHTIGNKIDSVEIRFLKPDLQLYYNYNYSQIEKFEVTKLDTANKIISGVFDFTLYKSPSDSVRITEGRFDLRFNVCKCSPN